jgi:H2-forming N5,N10-methylenetetrahydromethanopterin dehydrogenase-like enzyme
MILKMLTAFVVLTAIIWYFFQVITYVPKEMLYNSFKKFLSVLVALIVASGIMFVFVQLF